MYQLRDYQQKAADAAVSFFRNGTGQGAILILPTGSGKSLVIAAIASSLTGPLLIFQPSKEILEQNYNKLLSYGYNDAAIFSASAGHKDTARITFATIGSVSNALDRFRIFRNVIVDECHLVNSKGGQYESFIHTMGCKVLGLTATPFRLSNTLFGSMIKFITRTRPRIFSQILYCCQVSDIMERGYLAPLNYYQLKVIDQSKLKVNSTGADYTDESIQLLFEQAGFAAKLSETVKRLINAGRRSILVFTRFLDEAMNLRADLGESLCGFVCGETPKKDRESILDDFTSGRIRVVANVGVLTTGFDFPALDTVILARPTMSLSLYYQMIGRAIRPYPGKRAWVVDLCGNIDRFGRVEDLQIKEERPGIPAVFSGEKKLTNVLIK